MRKLYFMSALLLFAGISFGQSFEQGGTLMVHQWITTVDDATLDKMVDHWEKIMIPEAKKYFPEATFQVLKGVGADNKNAVATLTYYKSMDDLRKYFNEDGTPTEVGGAAYAVLMPMLEEMKAKYGELSFTIRDWMITR